MAQPFDCLCGKPTCRGRISGARDMTKDQLQGIWLNGHIIDLLRDQERGVQNGQAGDTTAQALQSALGHAQKVVEAARLALQTYTGGSSRTNGSTKTVANGRPAKLVGAERRGLTSRELSGEMGGDTVRV